MEALHKKFSGKGLVVIGANMGETAKTMAEAKKYPSQHKYSYTFTSSNDKLAEKLGIQGIPCFIFVDKTGKIKAVRTGFDPNMGTEFEKLAKSIL